MLISLKWCGGTTTSLVNSGGCLILFDTNEISSLVKTENDAVGRWVYILTKKDDKRNLIFNIYAPNNHNVAFFTKKIDTITCITNKLNNTNIYILGDWNLTLSLCDYSNRKPTTQENKAIKLIGNRTNMLSLIDCYRHMHHTGGLTWTRGNTGARLNMIFTNKPNHKYITQAVVDQSLESSDHGAVLVDFKNTQIEQGPGIHRLNYSCLNNPSILTTCKNELKEWISLIPTSWNPNT